MFRRLHTSLGSPYPLGATLNPAGVNFAIFSENAEKIEDFFTRISLIYGIFLEEYSGKKILVVAHAGVIRAALMHAMGAGPGQMYNVEIRNGMISRVRYRSGRTGLELINGTIETPA